MTVASFGGVRRAQTLLFVVSAGVFGWLTWLIDVHGRPDWAPHVLRWFEHVEAAPFEALMIALAFLGAGLGLQLLLAPVLFLLGRARLWRDVGFVPVSLLVAQVIDRVVKGAIAERRPTAGDPELLHSLSDVRRVAIVVVAVALIAALATRRRRTALALAAILAASYLL